MSWEKFIDGKNRDFRFIEGVFGSGITAPPFVILVSVFGELHRDEFRIRQ